MAENQEEFPTEISDDMFVREVPTDDKLKSVQQLAQELRTVQCDLLETETLLKALKQRETQISQTDLPAIMQQIGLDDFTLSDGSKISMKPVFIGSIKKDQMHEALEYLNTKGYGDAMKNELKASASANISQTEFIEIQKLLRDKYGVDFEQKFSVHHSSMKKIIRLMQEDIDKAHARGENPEPIDPILNPHIFNKVTLK
jgi:hypothetical protein